MAKPIRKPKTILIQLKTGDQNNGGVKTRKFDSKLALSLLSLANAQWELDDKNYSFNGSELIKNKD